MQDYDQTSKGRGGVKAPIRFEVIASTSLSLQRVQISRRVLALVAVALNGMPLGVSAQDCPTEQSGKSGFVVERGDKQKSDIFHSDDGIVRTVMRYNGLPLLETTQYQGLFQLDRLDEGRRTSSSPKPKSKSFFPSVRDRLPTRSSPGREKGKTGY